MEAAAASLSDLSAASSPAEAVAALQAAAAAAESAAPEAADGLTAALLSALPLEPLRAAAAADPEPLSRLTAALARHAPSRAALGAAGVASQLIAALRAAASPAAAPAALVQPARALGNLCCDCDAARRQLMVTSGRDAVAAAVARAAATGKEGARAREVVSGMVLNLVNDHTPALQWAVESGVARQLIAAAADDVSEAAVTCSAAARHTLVIASLISDSEQRERLVETQLAPLLAACLLPGQDESVLEEALDAASSWAPHPGASLAMAQAGVADSLCRLLPSPSCPPGAANLLVELLSGDEAMAAVYRRGEGAVYRAVLSWLAGAEGEDLATVACHALGNFATNDDHAEAMVRSGVHRDLLPRLSGGLRQQVAALGLLRNLCLAPANKQALLEEGLLETLLQLDVAEQPALFKYYAALRLLAADSGAACGRLANYPGFLARLTEAAGGDGPYGLHHEARRLLARIARTARCEDVSGAVTAAGGLGPLVMLLKSDSAVMANEALLALCLTQQHADAPQIVSSGLAPALSEMMSNDTLPPEIGENATTLLRLLRSRGEPALLAALASVPEPDLPPALDR